MNLQWLGLKLQFYLVGDFSQSYSKIHNDFRVGFLRQSLAKQFIVRVRQGNTLIVDQVCHALD